MPCLADHFACLEICNNLADEPILANETLEKDAPEIEIDPHRILIHSASLRRSTELQLHIESVSNHWPIGVIALLDSGATGLFIDEEFAEAKGFPTKKLPRAIQVYNIDGTLNEYGAVRETVDLIVRYQDHTERATFYVTQLGGTPLILGHPWLVEHNPEIDWTTGKVLLNRCPSECRVRHITTQRKHRQRQKARKHEFAMHIQATSTISQQFAEESEKAKASKSLKKGVPQPYQCFNKVFAKESFDKLPEHRKWDHAIDLVPNAELFPAKLYAMSPKEQVELERFLDEHLASGRIRHSKSPIASPVFFIKKKMVVCD